MAEKQFNTRIIHKHDTAENWAKATSFIPKKGELIVYDIDAEYNYERIKLGDGVKTVNELEFLQSDNYPIIKKTGSIVTARSLDGLQINPTTFIEPLQEGSGEPSPDNVRAISGWDSITVDLAKKNLLPPFKKGFVINSEDGTELSRDTAAISPYIAWHGETPLYLSGMLETLANCLFFYDKNKKYIGRTAGGINYPERKIQRDDLLNTGERCLNARYIRISVYEILGTTTGTINDIDTATMMLERGETATDYEPYQGQTLTADLPETVYGGTLDWGTGVLTVDRGIVDLGSLVWNLESGTSSAGDFTYFKQITAIPNMSFESYVYTQPGDLICEMYPTMPWGEITGKKDKFIAMQNTYFAIKDMSYADKDSFKAAMSGVMMVYPLATPYTIQLTPQQLEAIDGTNHVWSNSGDTEAIFNLTANTKINSAGTELGTVKTGGDVTIADGVITVNDDSHNHVISNVDGLQTALDAKATPANITSAIAALDYTSPKTSGTALEFITTINQADGVVSATKAAIPVASSNTLGLVKSGTDITVDASGNVSVNNNSHTHTIANVTNLQSTLDAKATPAQITSAIAALDASDPTASGTATSFISTISQTDGVISATKASLPTAGTSLGMVKSGGDVTISSGTITVNDDSHNHIISNVDGLQDALNAKATPANITSAIAALDYTGATASGNATSFITQVTQTDGVVSATKASIPIATSSQAGLVKSGTDITVDSNGNVSVNNNSHSHTSANISDLSTTISTAITNAIGALDASDPAASGSATQFITSISQKDGVITATKANITAAALGLSGAMKFLGTSATAITDGATTNPITIGSTSTTVASGNVVLYGSKEFVWNGSAWEELGNEGSYKVQQSAVSSPSASGTTTAFIDTISQNAQGVITATKKTVASATQSAAGLMSAADKAKLDGIASGATANTGDITGVTAGNGLTGGGSSGSVTLNVGAGSGITVAADTVSVNTSYTTSGKNYKVAVDSTTGGLYANVPWTDTKNTAGSTNSDSKLFLIGATSQAANPQTYSDSEVYTTNGTLTAKTFSGSGASLTSLNASNISSGTIAAARLPAATTSAQGAMTSTMVTKLNGIATGATADTAITTAEINGVCV